MKIKVLFIFIINLLFLGAWFEPVFALEHTQKDGLFKMDIPKQWHWVESPQEIFITFPDGKTMAIDIEIVPSRKLSQEEIKKALKDADDKMIKEGIEAHQGTLIDQKEIKLDGIYAKQLDFKTVPPDPVFVTYIILFNKDNAIAITYGSKDEKMRLMMEDAVATFKFN